MFTGLIRHLGTLESRVARSGRARLRIAAPVDLLERADRGSSVCVNGVCLTAVERDARHFEADLSEETLERTTFARLPFGSILNLEPSLRMGDPMDGHLVSGHVDGVGRILERAVDEGLWRFSFEPERAPMIASKGSIAVDGISLTVADCGKDWFSVALIPETVRATRLAGLSAGDDVNLEVDPIGRYVARNLALGASEQRLQRFVREGWREDR